MAPRNAIFRRLFACVSSPASSTRESVEQYAEKPAPHSPAAEVDDYDGRLELIRRREYPQLYNASSQLATVFLDNTGSTLYAASHIRAQAEEMLTVMPANPHSHHTGSKWAHDKIEQARDRLLGFFGASSRDYALVFTANATAAIRLAGELVPLSKESTYCYTSAAHTSVVGLRSIASEWGATVRAADFDDLDDIIQPEATTGVSLVAYPAQCNFSGQRFPWDIADKVASRFPTTADSDKHSEGHAPWWVLVDAASYAASSPLNLGALRTGPDFVAVSMYKIFGAPTGVGALLVRRSSVPFLKRKRFFGGGTVTVLSFDHMWQEFRDETYRVASDEISAWLTSVLAVECYLACDPRLLLSSEASEHALASPDTLTESATATKSEPSPVLCPARRSELSFANESQILLVTSESSQKVAEWIAEEQGGDSGTAQANAAPVGPLQYRPNIVVKSAPSGSGPGRAIQPFEEFKWSSVSIGSTHLQVSGPCRRCQMIAVDQESAESLKEPYSVLARKMRIDGKVVFGIYLDNIDGAPNRMHRDSIATIQSGSLLSVAINDWQKLV
ncbi:hypothetical protein GGI04_000316 [Coemansia thaxteri]|nr:hypothetical protein GGI04_000316 [Coemansia thaxteri]